MFYDFSENKKMIDTLISTLDFRYPFNRWDICDKTKSDTKGMQSNCKTSSGEIQQGIESVGVGCSSLTFFLISNLNVNPVRYIESPD